MTGDTGKVRRYFGSALLAGGVLIAGLCGLCTLVFMGGALFGGETHPFTPTDMVIMASIIGGIPTVVGVVLALWGRALLNGGGGPIEPKSGDHA
jgi:hypothetical protein